MTWKEKLKTLTSKWHPTRTELASIATTGDYNDLINTPQGGGGGSSEEKPIIIKANLTELRNYINEKIPEVSFNDEMSRIISQLNTDESSFMTEIQEDTGEAVGFYTASNAYLMISDMCNKHRNRYDDLYLFIYHSNMLRYQEFPYKIKSETDSSTYETTVYFFFKNNFDEEITSYSLYKDTLHENSYEIVFFTPQLLTETEEGYIYEINFNSESTTDPGDGR